MRDNTDFSLDTLFPDLENTSDYKEIELKKPQSLTVHDITKLVLALEETVDRNAARRMLLHHVEPPIKPFIPKTHQEVPLDLKLAQASALKGNINALQSHLMDYLKESKNLPRNQVFVVEEMGRIVH